MSQRPKEAVDQASRFSLRHIFGNSAGSESGFEEHGMEYAQAQPQAQTHAQAHAQAQAQAQHHPQQHPQQPYPQQPYAAYYAAAPHAAHAPQAAAAAYASPAAPTGAASVPATATHPYGVVPAHPLAQRAAVDAVPNGPTMTQRAALTRSFKFTLSGDAGAGVAGSNAGTGIGAGTGLRFNLPQLGGSGGGGGALPQTAALSASGPSAALPVSDADGAATSGRALRAGFLTGGSAKGGDAAAEVMRLNALVDDLTNKLSKAQERCQTVETSIHKGNVSVAAERQQHEQRLAALTAELHGAQERERALSAELAQLPRKQEHELERFRIQAKGAVELQSNYETVSKKLEALEAEAAFLRKDQQRSSAASASTSEHNQKIVAELATAQAQLQVSQNHVAGLMAERDQLRQQVESGLGAEFGHDSDAASTAAARAVETVNELEVFVEEVRTDCEARVAAASAASAEAAATATALAPRVEELTTALAQAHDELQTATARADAAETAESTAACECARVRKEAAEAAADAARAAAEAAKAKEKADAAEAALDVERSRRPQLQPHAQVQAQALGPTLDHLPPEEACVQINAALSTNAARDDFSSFCETVIEGSRKHAARCTAADVVAAVDGVAPLALDAYTLASVTAQSAATGAAEPTRQTVEEKARVDKLVAAISADLKVFVMDSTLKWKARQLGATVAQTMQLLSTTAA